MEAVDATCGAAQQKTRCRVVRSAIPSAAADLHASPSALAERAEVLGAVALVLHDPDIAVRTSE